MAHEITPEEIRAARDVGEVEIACASNGLKSKRMVWHPTTGTFRVTTGAAVLYHETPDIMRAAISYNELDI